MHIDRARQKEILEILANVYPSYTTDCVRQSEQTEDLKIIWYLREYELVEGALDHALSGSIIFQGAKITAKGLDFLADDGGLSSILGTVVVKLHADTLRELILSRVNDSLLPDSEKSWFKKTIETMSSESLKTLTKSLVEKGIEHAPNLLQLAKTAAQSYS
jgi:hypothetical protein